MVGLDRLLSLLQLSVHCLKSFLHVPPEKISLLTFQREADRQAGGMKYLLSICTVPLVTLFLILTLMFITHMASLQGSVLYLMCVFVFFFKKMMTSVYCWCLCQVQFVGLVCLPSFLFYFFQTGSLLCSWSG